MKEKKTKKTQHIKKRRKHNVLTEDRKYDAMQCQPHPKGSGKKSTLIESHPYFLNQCLLAPNLITNS